MKVGKSSFRKAIKPDIVPVCDTANAFPKLLYHCSQGYPHKLTILAICGLLEI